MNGNRANWREEIILRALESTANVRDDVDIVGPERARAVVSAAIEGKGVEASFDLTTRGAELSVVDTLQILLLYSQIALLWIEIWTKARSGLDREEFHRQIELSRPSDSRLKDWRELADKVFELLSRFHESGKDT